LLRILDRLGGVRTEHALVGVFGLESAARG
jgi:hypothetical protein